MHTCMQITLTLSKSLPTLLDNEIYLCHFANNELSFTVDAVGSGMTYTCNITGRNSHEAQYQALATG